MDTNTISVSSGISEETDLNANAIAGRYASLAGVREGLLERARGHAALTIPSLFPEAGTSEDQMLLSPYQSVGARGVNNLSNKLLLTLFPVSSPFFKLEIPEGIIQQLQEADPSVKEVLEAGLTEMENTIQSDLEINAFRAILFVALRQLIVVGDFLLHIPAKGEPRGFKLDKYVVKRSVSGTPLEIILKEVISREELPQEWLDQLQEADKLDSHSSDDSGRGTGALRDRKYDLYTRIHLEGQWQHEAKYIHGVKLEGSEAKYPKEASAWLPLRWGAEPGEDYGRSYVESYSGDLLGAEGLARSIQEHSAIASKTFGVLRPNSNMTPADIARVPNGGFIVGEPEDLVYPEVGKRNDMQVAQATFESLKDSLSRAFLITQVRDSERTTAEEIRMMASELETALGGAYSLLGVTLQRPLLLREIDRLQKDTTIKLPKIDKREMEPKVIVGLEGLGRGTDLEKLMKAVAAIAQIAPNAQHIPQLDMAKIVQFTFNAVGLDSAEVLKSEEQKQAEQQAQQQAQQAQQMSEAMSKGAGAAIPKLAERAVDNPEGVQNVMQGLAQAAGPQPT